MTTTSTSTVIDRPPLRGVSGPWVLLVDDEKRILKLFDRNFRSFFPILTAHSTDAGIDLMKTHEVGVLISDQRMPNKDGSIMLQYAGLHHPRTVKILTTAYQDYEILVKAINELSIFGFFTKPWDNSQIINTVSNALALYSGESQSLAHSPNITSARDHKRISIDLTKLPDLLALISIFQSQSKNLPIDSKSCTIRQLGDDFVISSEGASDSTSIFSLSLSDVKRAIQLSETMTPDKTGVIIEKNVALIKTESVQGHSRHLLYSSVRLVQLGSYLRSVRIQAGEGKIAGSRSRTGNTARFRGNILEIENQIAEAESKDNLDAKSIRAIAEKISDFLHRLNTPESLDQKVLEIAKIEPSTISAIYASYNVLAGELSLQLITPSPEVLHPKKSAFSTETSIHIAFSTMTLFILLLMSTVGLFAESKKPYIGPFVTLVLASLCSGIAAGSILGSAKLDGRFKLLDRAPFGLGEDPVKVSATSGFVVMLVVLLSGIAFMKMFA